VLPSKHSPNHAVGEAHVYVQGASLKTCAALLVRLPNSPITRSGGEMPKTTIPMMIALSCVTVGCADRSEASAIEAARRAVGDPRAPVEAVRKHWTPTYQDAVCGRIGVGVEKRRFVALMTSDGTATEAMIEGAALEEKQAFEETIWRPTCAS